MTIKNFSEAHKILAEFVPPSPKFREQYNLDNMRMLMSKLGNPQETFRTIHVAGTSGKTSTCYYLAALLGQTGAKIGLTVSPYVDEVNERIQINLKPMPEAEFCPKLTEFLEIISGFNIKPTYFELLVALAYWEFARQKVDYAVVEVGMGGLLDGTNVINREDKVCVITDIGLDHTNILGGSINEIAVQKAGIIQSHNQVIMHRQDKEVMQAVDERVKTQQAKLELVGQNQHLALNDMPWFQRRNWQLALAVYQYITARDGLKKLNESKLHQTMHIYIPARMEIVEYGGRTIIMDGAHNPQKMQALCRSLKLKFPGRKLDVIIGLLSGKDLNIEEVIEELKPVTGYVVATAFSAEQDMPRGSIDPSEIAQVCHQLDVDCDVVKDPKLALRQVIEGSSSLILVTGSFYLLNHIRPLILKSDD